MMGYHITKIENLLGENGIAEKGLLPRQGERSKQVGDNRVTICFTDDYYNLPFWKEQLYESTDSNELCVLTFQEDRKRCIKEYRELSTNCLIPPEEIYVVIFYNRITFEEISLEELSEYNEDISYQVAKKMIPIREYTPYIESKENYQYCKKNI